MTIQWSLVLFTVLSGMGAWCFVCVAIDCFVNKAPKAAFPAALVAGICAIAGGLCSVTHLGNPERIFAALTHVGVGIFLEMVLIGILIVCIIVFLLLMRREQEAVAKAFAVIGAIAGAALSIALGASYMMEARPLWDTVLMPVAYCGSAMALGSAAYLLVVGLCGEATEDAAKFYGTIAAVFGAVGAVCVLAYGVVAGAVSNMAIWAGVVLLAVGAVCAFLCAKDAGKLKAMAAVAVVCALAGAIAFRAAMWMLGTPVLDAFGVVL